MTTSRADRPCPTISSNGARSAGAALDRAIAAIDAGTRELAMKPFNAGILIGTTNDAVVPTGSGS